MSVTRTRTDSVLFTTYNLLDLGAGEHPYRGEHYRLVAESIRALGTDVLAVQEIRAPDQASARRRLRRLADDTGLECLVKSGGRDSVPAVALGSHGYHCGLLWRSGIEPVPGSLRTRSQDLWHALVWVALDVGGTVVRHASYHAPPFGRRIRADQNEVVLASLGVPGGGAPTLAGADWNCESADRVLDPGTGRWELYEPADPFAGVPWFPDLVYQCEWDYDECGRRRHRADRTAGEVLWAGGLLDAAAVVRAAWQPTTGHYPGDAYGRRGVARRIDAVRVSADVAGALCAHEVTSDELARRASDHLPVTVEYLPPAIISARAGGRPAPG